MGEKKRKMTRIEKFKGEHPYCCLCGGKRQTETIEHAPPKVIFWDKLRLQGMEVPACKRCNNGTGAEDQLAAFFAIMQSPSFYGSSNNEKMLDYFTKLMAGCKNNVPCFSTLFTDSGNVLLESKGIIQTHNKLTFKPELFTKHLNKWAAKQALAHWYHNSNSIFSEEGIILVRWLTNYELMNNKKIPELVSIFTNLDELIQGSQKSGEQFFIRYPNTKAGDNIHMMFSAYHGTAFIAAMVDDANWKTKFEPNILGNHSAAFCTNEATGLYLYETSDP